jgi:hypothetical protein
MTEECHTCGQTNPEEWWELNVRHGETKKEALSKKSGCVVSTYACRDCILKWIQDWGDTIAKTKKSGRILFDIDAHNAKIAAFQEKRAEERRIRYANN